MIDTTTFEYADSRWQDIFLHLKKNGFNVYSPATKDGECKEEYIVLKHDGSSKLPNFSSDSDIYAIMCYVPKKKYSKLEPMVQRVKQVMKELEPMIMSRGVQTPSFYDDEYKAHMVSISYYNYKKI